MNTSLDGDISGTSVSRSGRVRKKNSLLAEYESSEQILDKPKRRGQVDSDEEIHDRTKGRLGDVKKRLKKSKKKMTPTKSRIGHGELEMDLSSELDEREMPNLAAEDRDGYSSSDVDDRTYHGNPTGKKLKTQAQSMYMMEKNKKHPKGGGGTRGASSSAKSKSAKKEKGPPRITAYTLWAKDQRELFNKKYPHMDPHALSKKLSEVWAELPTNQKKMWKNKADKITKTNLNIKNSAPLSSAAAPGKKRGRPRIHPRPGEKFESSRQNGSKSPTKATFQTKGFRAAEPFTWTPKNASKPGNSRGTNGVGYFKQASQYAREPVLPSSSNSITDIRQFSPKKEEETVSYKVTGTGPLDIAAHLSLLGESLSIIGERLMDVERQPVSGSLSVLMDSLLCAVTPLICLTQQVPELNCIPDERLTKLLDHVAYIMPGL